MAKVRWRWIDGYRGWYKVSDSGKVKSVDRMRPYGNGFRPIPGKLLKPFTDCQGYQTVKLCKDGTIRAFSVARLVLSTFSSIKPTEEADHKNRKPSDNRLSNLRPATHVQNNCNKGRRIDNTSGFPGVFWIKERELWGHKLVHKGKVVSRGAHDTKVDAISAYKAAARKHHKEFRPSVH